MPNCSVRICALLTCFFANVENDNAYRWAYGVIKLRQHRTKQQKSAAQNNRVKAVYSIAKFRSHGAL